MIAICQKCGASSVTVPISGVTGECHFCEIKYLRKEREQYFEVADMLDVGVGDDTLPAAIQNVLTDLDTARQQLAAMKERAEQAEALVRRLRERYGDACESEAVLLEQLRKAKEALK